MATQLLTKLACRTGQYIATYTFAAPAAAKYVSESINAQVAWINHVPHNMLVGPAIPINHSVTLGTRYTPSMFEVSRPQVLHRTSDAIMTKVLLDTRREPQFNPSFRGLFLPLPPIGQHPGYHIGFFEQGIITGGLLSVSSIIAIVAATGYWAFKARN